MRYVNGAIVTISVLWVIVAQYNATCATALLKEQSVSILELQRDLFELKLQRIDPGNLQPPEPKHLDDWRADI